MEEIKNAMVEVNGNARSQHRKGRSQRGARCEAAEPI